MVLNRSVEYGFKGYQVPATPRAARSARRRSSFKRKVEDNKMFAFDLLATVAGKLLIGNDNSPTPCNLSTKNNQCSITDNGTRKECHEQLYVQEELEPCNEGSPGLGSIDSQLVMYDHDSNHSFKEILDPVNGDNMSYADMTATLDCSRGLGADKLGIDKSKDEGNFARKVGLGYPVNWESAGCRLEEETKNKEDLVIKKASFSTDADTYHLGDAVVWNAKPLAQVSCESSAKVPFYENKDHFSHNTFPHGREDVVVVSKDDDENSSGCTHPCSSRPPPCIGDRRIRKVLASKYCKASSNTKNEPASRTDVKLKPFYRDRKSFYKRQRSQRIYPFKKRKFFDIDSESNSDGGISGNGDPGDFPVNWPSSPAVRQHSSSHQSSDSHVKLKIESFRVPELFIELPETATVGSLKRTVMEAVSAILGGELRVGVLLQGKKVGDDSKTLLQTGISHNNQQGALGFALEPISLKNPSSGNPGPLHFLPHGDSPPHCSRYPPIAAEVHKKSSDVLPQIQGTNIGNIVESDRDSATSPAALSHKAPSESKALVPVSAISAKALSVVPAHRKSKRCEIAQRRIRRPFSVAEVEALVQAVEKLGTGRWRDVKLRAFDSAKHRTYVDLKDKWKTLVHTARISPQQRRGEPVPQELLDRVLTAHAYWSQQQAKQQVKQPTGTPCLLLS